MKYRGILLLLVCMVLSVYLPAQLMAPKTTFTHADTLRGTINENRKGWDLLHYDLLVEPNIAEKTIQGKNTITYKVTEPFTQMQIDLQQPLIVDSVTGANNLRINFSRDNNICLVNQEAASVGITAELTIYYHGKPTEATRPPWDGGLVWKKDDKGNAWVATACQGLGASVWWPCKDHQSDEPDKGMTIKIVAPDTLSAVSNGRLVNTTNLENGRKMWTWQVKNPINSYGVTMNIGKYAHWTDTISGEDGKLGMQYWVLEYNLKKAQKQFDQAKTMLHTFEYWFGKYPFYEDSYKLVETPFLGMEHQSAIAYGNHYENGYLGTDLSGTGWGMKWDFIIIHESGHEWFGNNITTNDVADMWVHESFTNYSETLYTETLFGKEAGNDYNLGTRQRIRNDKNIIGPYGVNKEGSGDMYYKGGNMLQLIRHSINNDSLFRNILRGLNKTFYHKTVTSQQVEAYISQESKMDFSTVFDQYLRTTNIPVLEYYVRKNKVLYYRWTNCVEGFSLSLALAKGDQQARLAPSSHWQKRSFDKTLKAVWSPSEIINNYYINLKKTTKSPKL